ncbi:hypothetical protein Bca4012_006087 [Brassica carinata]
MFGIESAWVLLLCMWVVMFHSVAVEAWSHAVRLVSMCFGVQIHNPMHILDDMALDQHEPASMPIPAANPSKKARKENSTKKKKKYFDKIQEVDGNAENKASQVEGVIRD